MHHLPSPARGRGAGGESAHTLALLPILGLAALLRLAALPRRGLIFWDEAKFALEGMRVLAALQIMAGRHVLPSFGKAIGSAKPTHALLFALAYALLGVHDYVPLLVDALASVAEVALTCLIASRLFSPVVGLIAALFLAVSQYDVLYARSALSENDATLLLLAGVLALVPDWLGAGSSRRRVLAAALLLGVGFTTNYRLIVYIAAVIAFDLARAWHAANLRSAARRLAPWLAGLMLAPLLWQVAELVAQRHGIVLFRGDLTQQQGYFREVVYQLHEGKQAVIRFDPLVYVQWYIVRQGPLMTILLAAGLILAAWRRSVPWLSMAAPAAGAYVAYTFAPFVVPRNLVAALPFAAVLAAAALAELVGWLPRRRGVALALLALLLGLVGALMAWELTAMRSGFAQAAAYVQRRGDGRALTTTEITVFYLRGSGKTCEAPAFPATLPALAAYVRAGYRYAILENHHNSPLTRYVRERGTRVAHYSALGPVALGESPIASENSNPPGTHPERETVDVYRLPEMAPMPGGHAVPCDRNQVV